MSYARVRQLLKLAASEPEVLQLLRDEPEKLQARLDFNSAEIEALQSADLLAAITQRVRQPTPRQPSLKARLPRLR